MGTYTSKTSPANICVSQSVASYRYIVIHCYNTLLQGEKDCAGYRNIHAFNYFL